MLLVLLPIIFIPELQIFVRIEEFLIYRSIVLYLTFCTILSIEYKPLNEDSFNITREMMSPHVVYVRDWCCICAIRMSLRDFSLVLIVISKKLFFYIISVDVNHMQQGISHYPFASMIAEFWQSCQCWIPKILKKYMVLIF